LLDAEDFIERSNGKGFLIGFVAISHKIARFGKRGKLAAEKSIRARSFTR
jgi:hypothetical protein